MLPKAQRDKLKKLYKHSVPFEQSSEPFLNAAYDAIQHVATHEGKLEAWKEESARMEKQMKVIVRAVQEGRLDDNLKKYFKGHTNDA